MEVLLVVLNGWCILAYAFAGLTTYNLIKLDGWPDTIEDAAMLTGITLFAPISLPIVTGICAYLSYKERHDGPS